MRSRLNFGILVLTRAPDIFNACWNTLSTRMRSQLDAIGEPISSLTPFMLRTFKSQFANDLQPYEAARGLLAAIIHCIFTHFEAILQDGQISASNQTRLTSLVEFLDVFGRDVFGDEELSKVTSS